MAIPGSSLSGTSTQTSRRGRDPALPRCISGWVADVPPPVLAGLYLRCGAAPAPPPSKTTIWRVLTDAGADELDAAAASRIPSEW